MTGCDSSAKPLGEVFGFPPNNNSARAKRFRRKKLCPFNNRVPSCTKDKANNPLGVCSIVHNNERIITCPVRFRQDWAIADDASAFFFPEDAAWTALTEVNLKDSHGKTAGHIDLVLVSYDQTGHIIDFGSVEIQAVYISGNIRIPFQTFMRDLSQGSDFSWAGESNYPKPDFLSSSRKRLIPQVLYKGGILHTRQKKQAIVLQSCFFETLPQMPTVDPVDAELAWILYDLKRNNKHNTFDLARTDVVYTQFESAMSQITTPMPGCLDEFLQTLQERLDAELEGNPPDAPTLGEVNLS